MQEFLINKPVDMYV